MHKERLASMLDIKLVRKNPEIIRENLKKRNDPQILELFEELFTLDARWRRNVAEVNILRQKRNRMSLEIAQLKKSGKTVNEELRESEQVLEKMQESEEEIRSQEERIRSLRSKIPNLIHDSVPVGKDEDDNVEIRRWGRSPKFGFEAKDHLSILKNLDLIDERATKIAGSGFFYLKKELALLDYAIQRFAIDFLMEKGFVLIEPPFMVNKEVYTGMIGDPAEFAEASYKIENEELYLIPTAEYPLGALFMNEVFGRDELPVKLVGVSPCFRKEVGTHGKYAKGLFRMHQFNKVEQFVFCLPEDSWRLHEELQRNSEELYQRLGLNYRVVNVCTGDLGKKAAKKYDLEVWMADNKFREAGSNSNCTDYQARRMNIKYRNKEGQPPIDYVHTLNNTALATSRTIIAIVEQFQQADGHVELPEVLWDYMGGIKRLGKEKNVPS